MLPPSCSSGNPLLNLKTCTVNTVENLSGGAIFQPPGWYPIFVTHNREKFNEAKISKAKRIEIF